MPISLDREKRGRTAKRSTHLYFAPRSSFEPSNVSTTFPNYELYKRERRKKLEYEYIGGYIFDGEKERERERKRTKWMKLTVCRSEREKSSRVQSEREIDLS